jgi:hypothetical protein
MAQRPRILVVDDDREPRRTTAAARQGTVSRSVM